MIATTKRFTHGPTFWILLLILAVTLECVGLYYQYVLNYGPCVLCIHVRMLVFALMLVAIALLFLHRFAVARILGLLTVSGIFIWLTERSWQLLATERGWVMGSCDMLSGLPVWVPLERWLPFLFEIKEPCGYTPDMPFGLTMAETLLAMNGALSILGLALLGIVTSELLRKK